MFSFLKKVVTTVIPWNSDLQENDLEENEHIIADRIQNLTTICTENCNEISENVIGAEETLLGQSDSIKYNLVTFKCVHKSGKVTRLSNDIGLIDGVIYFESNQVSKGLVLKVNDEVLYTAYRAKENEAERVFKIYALKNDPWGCGNAQEIGSQTLNLQDLKEIPAMNRIITGRVTRRRGREFYIESADVWCNLDKVQTSYIPIEGDWVELNATVYVSEETADMSGDILEVNSLKPLLMKSGVGRISLWSDIKNEGAIENFIYFTIASCADGYSPSLGDEVLYEAVESDQERFKWRALKVLFKKINMGKKYERSSKRAESLKTDDNVPYDDKNGITIVPSVCAVEIELNQIKTVTFEIRNNGSVEQFLKEAKFHQNKNLQLVLLSPKDLNQTFIYPNESILYTFQCEGKHLGLTGEVFHFYFENFTVTTRFEINVVSNKDMNRFLECKFDTVFKVFKRDRAVKDEVDPDMVLYGPRPWKAPKFVSRERRCIFNVPKKLWSITGGNPRGMKTQALTDYAPYLKTQLNFQDYAERFHTLLYLEEIDLKANFRKYDMKQVLFEKCDSYLRLEVPGLVERRPCLIVGDKVVVIQPWSEDSKVKHVGYIHDIREKEVFVKFHDSFHDNYDDSECDIIFEPNTGFFARCHEAVNRSVKVLGEQWLFPSSVNEKPPQITFEVAEEEEDMPEKVADFFKNIPKKQSAEKKPVPPSCDLSEIESNVKGQTNAAPSGKNKMNLVWGNKKLNDRQKLAVVNVLKGQGRPLPYIIFGPPGTGKTHTLVEIVIQIYRMMPESRILITTPSNSAADLICERLIDFGNFKPGQLVRLVAIYRVFEGLVPAKLIPYSTFFKPKWAPKRPNLDDFAKNKIKGSSLTELIGRHRITVATCVTIGGLHYSDIPSGHFSHILVDEAGQTSEPESLITISFQNVQNGQVVLAGDPQQLGPIICCNMAKIFGLGTSLLQRLISTFPYCRDLDGFPSTSGYDPRFITKLIINYRCVPEILLLPSQMFYNSDLVSAVSQTHGEEAEIIKKFNFKAMDRETPPAIIFNGIIGQNYQDKDSPSWFNPHEIWQVVFYIRKLYSIGLDCDKIGVVSPYSKQVQKLKQLLSALGMSNPKIGSVEEFQGQERFVIIVSTVRSSPKQVISDIAHSLGFVALPQRLNVALTRARALLIIIGNPFLLSVDPYWLNVVKYCIKNKSYTGCSLESLSEKLAEDTGANAATKEKKKAGSDVAA